MAFICLHCQVVCSYLKISAIRNMYVGTQKGGQWSGTDIIYEYVGTLAPQARNFAILSHETIKMRSFYALQLMSQMTSILNLPPFFFRHRNLIGSALISEGHLSEVGGASCPACPPRGDATASLNLFTDGRNC